MRIHKDGFAAFRGNLNPSLGCMVQPNTIVVLMLGEERFFLLENCCFSGNCTLELDFDGF